MSIIESIREVKGTLSPYEKMKRSIIEKKLESEPFMKLCNCQRFSKYKTSSDCICMKDRSKKTTNKPRTRMRTTLSQSSFTTTNRQESKTSRTWKKSLMKLTFVIMCKKFLKGSESHSSY
uniref:Uncharacterized protein n=1 Tax=Lepeophtheirus salmonis TaxID=72036 RepID=A0A0K2SYP6_LEPSM